VRRILWLLLFFRIVAPVPRLLLTTFGVVTAAAAILTVLQPERAADSLTPLLLLQLFAASSGFSIPAGRGHYDLILTSGESRFRIALAHWTMSIAPGVASWVCLGVIELVMLRGSRSGIVTSGSIVALILVSTLPWAMSVTLPRFSVAIAWQLVVALVAVVFSTTRVPDLSESIVGGLTWVEAAVAVLVYPPVVVGVSVARSPELITLPALAVAAGAMALAFLWIDRHDMPLEAPQ
jgi:hypothetical protein